MNDLETRFRSWPLRSPSPRLKHRLFAQPAAARSASVAEDQSPLSDHPSPPFRLAWLAPATMALLLLCIMFNQRNNPFPASPGTGTMVAVALSNQSAASWLPGSFAHDQNTVPAETFEWTNGSGGSSNARMFRGTN
jgi:hypothetical protein